LERITGQFLFSFYFYNHAENCADAHERTGTKKGEPQRVKNTETV